MNKKPVLVALGVLVVLGIILAVLLGSGNEDGPKNPVLPIETEVQNYSNAVYTVTLKFPEDWIQVPGEPDRYIGESGFMHMSATGGSDVSIDRMANFEAFTKSNPYGTSPKIEKAVVGGQPARYIYPSKDQSPNLGMQSALIVQYPQPVKIQGAVYNYFMITSDEPHLRAFGPSLKFAASTSTSATSTAPAVERPVSSKVGLLGGHVDIGPVCPAGNPEQKPCVPTAETYATYKVFIYKKGTTPKQQVAQLPVDNRGSFLIGLEPGAYTLDRELKPGVTGNLPQDVTITTGTSSTLNITINTGIK